MIKPAAILIGWVAVAGLTSTATWQGIGMIGEQVTDDRPAPLNAAAVQRALVEPDAIVEAEPPIVAVAPEAPVAPNVTVADAANPPTGRNPVPVTSSPTTVTRPPTTVAPTRPPTAATPAPTTTTTTIPKVTAPALPVAVRTYNLIGGTVSLRYTPDGVTVVFANPKPGFRSSVDSHGGNGVRVQFRSPDHRSRVTGTWRNGPVDEIEETVQGKGASSQTFRTEGDQP